MKGYLVLENGRIFEGKVFGSMKGTVGEVVFNTGMTGYQELITDPSYFGQMVVMTYPLIGNYGINKDDIESDKPKIKGLIVSEKCDNPSNFRSSHSLEEYLEKHDIPGIEGIDIRELTRILRNNGTMKGSIVIGGSLKDMDEAKKTITSFQNIGCVQRVTTERIYQVEVPEAKYNVAVVDYGIKTNIIRSLTKRNCRLTVFPAHTKAEEILKINPHGVFLSNGPGDPKELTEAIGEIKKLIGTKPILGICLGHQLLWLALGGDTNRLVYGHRGCNHPVKDFIKDRVYITSQNHGYVASDSCCPEDIEITHRSMNDNSIEGMRHKRWPILSVQFHPEACPGPEDTSYVFDMFIEMMGGK